jgi:uncharacterized membrane protein YedE/YeeE
MNIQQQLLLAAFAAAFVIGAAAQASRFCPQGGLRELLMQGRPERLAVYAVSIGTALFAVAALQLAWGHALAPTRPPYLSPVFAWGRYVAGGLLFGAGMVLARGCPLRAIVRTGEGSAWSLLLLVVMAGAAYAFSRTTLFDQLVAPWSAVLSVDLRHSGFASQGIDAIVGATALAARAALGAVLGLALLALAARSLSWRAHRTAWIAAAAIGLMVAAAYALTAGPIGSRAAEEAMFASEPPEGMGVQSFSYAGPLSDAVHFLLRPSAQTFSFGVVVLLGTLLGAFASAAVRREVRLQAMPAGAAPVRQIFGAALTGAGAVIGLGCTIGHGLSGVPVLSAGSLLGLASIFTGAAAVVWLEGRGQVQRASAAPAGLAARS